MVEKMWNERDLVGRKTLLEVLGLNYKINDVDNRLFEELPQLYQKWMIDAANVVF